MDSFYRKCVRIKLGVISPINFCKEKGRWFKRCHSVPPTLAFKKIRSKFYNKRNVHTWGQFHLPFRARRKVAGCVLKFAKCCLPFAIFVCQNKTSQFSSYARKKAERIYMLVKSTPGVDKFLGSQKLNLAEITFLQETPFH